MPKYFIMHEASQSWGRNSDCFHTETKIVSYNEGLKKNVSGKTNLNRTRYQVNREWIEKALKL